MNHYLAFRIYGLATDTFSAMVSEQAGLETPTENKVKEDKRPHEYTPGEAEEAIRVIWRKDRSAADKASTIGEKWRFATSMSAGSNVAGHYCCIMG